MKTSKEEILKDCQGGFERITYRIAIIAMQEYAEVFHKEKLPEELKKFFAYFHASSEGAEEIVNEYLKPKAIDNTFQTSPTVLDQKNNNE